MKTKTNQARALKAAFDLLNEATGGSVHDLFYKAEQHCNIARRYSPENQIQYFFCPLTAEDTNQPFKGLYFDSYEECAMEAYDYILREGLLL